jgi:hypothetical protein
MGFFSGSETDLGNCATMPDPEEAALFLHEGRGRVPVLAMSFPRKIAK